jgi:RNA polymerase sigma factor (sigma-70 family)
LTAPLLLEQDFQAERTQKSYNPFRAARFAGRVLMSEDSTFRDLIDRARAGDNRAAEELMRNYGPAIRLVVRRRLKDPSLRRLLDTSDIYNSSLSTFFFRLRQGEFKLERPDDLMNLLATMAHNKICNHAEQQKAARRDHRRNHPDGEVVDQVADPASSPSSVVATKDFLQQIRSYLSEEEWHLMDLRFCQECSWEEVAAQVGGQVDAVRMRVHRALARVRSQMKLEE